MHVILASIFFGATGFYVWIIAGILSENKLKYPPDMWACFAILKKLRVVMMASLLAFLYFINADGTENFWTPFFEWFSVILFLNVFAFASFMNKYYQSVLPITPAATSNTLL
mmetsp:Transcript_3548/g.2577  ORF Transcript_3548/g.2577 Transcript_3548/m.2577 type:complete len:112 (-) Transcript_3548:39-374(-)